MPIPTYSELLGGAGKTASRGGEGGSVLVWVNSAEMLGYCSRSSQEGLQIAFGERDLRAATALDNHLPSGVVWRWVHNETLYVSSSYA